MYKYNNIEYCSDCPFFNKKEGFYIDTNIPVASNTYACDEIQDWYIGRQIQLEMETENYYAKKNYNE